MESNEPPRKKYGLKPREFDRLNAPGKAPEKSGEHDVPAMLQQNRSVERQAGKDKFELRETKSRRKRDYWVSLFLSSGFFGVLAWLGRDNPFVLIAACSGLVLAAVGLTWVIWFVMDDY